MEFAYNPDGSGVRLNQSGRDGELTGECTRKQRKWGTVDEYYTAPSGVLTPMTQEEVDEYNAIVEKNNAFTAQVAAIEAKKKEENDKPFPYNGSYFKVNEGASDDIQGYQNLCLSLPSDEPIPTFPQTATLSGKWLSFDNSPIGFTCGEFITFYNAIITRSTWNFDTRVQHQIVLSSLYADGTKTAQDILDYDYSEGWK